MSNRRNAKNCSLHKCPMTGRNRDRRMPEQVLDDVLVSAQVLARETDGERECEREG